MWRVGRRFKLEEWRTLWLKEESGEEEEEERELRQFWSLQERRGGAFLSPVARSHSHPPGQGPVFQRVP